jgi:Transposase IS116/IS110/IS902 family
VKHRSVQAQADLMVIRARAGLLRARTGLGERGAWAGQELRPTAMRLQYAEYESGESRKLESGAASRAETTVERNRVPERAHRGIQRAHREPGTAEHPQLALLKQIKGVGTLIALTFLLTLEDPHRFRKSRDVGGYLGLQPGRRNSGQSDPQMHISKECDPYLRTLLVQGAQHISGSIWRGLSTLGILSCRSIAMAKLQFQAPTPEIGKLAPLGPAKLNEFVIRMLRQRKRGLHGATISAPSMTSSNLRFLWPYLQFSSEPVL